MADYAYPAELAQFVSRHWATTLERPVGPPTSLEACGTEPLLLEAFLSVCYQASLLWDEQRPVRLRAMLCRPSDFPCDQYPPMGFHLLLFDAPRPCTPAELRALAPAAPFARALIGVALTADGALEIWGIVHSGPRWLREVQGGRNAAPPLPPAVVVCVNGPGDLEVCKGSRLIGQLRDGTVSGAALNVFEARWLLDVFAEVRGELLALHAAARAAQGRAWAALDPTLIRVLAQQMVKRLIATVQFTHHGGLVMLVPPGWAETLLQPNPYVHVKYRVQAAATRARYQTLLLAILETLATLPAAVPPGAALVGWQAYEHATDATLTTLDDALFEMASLLAGLTAVDGAVVLTKRFDVLGFGAEILCHAAEVTYVARALDREAAATRLESVEGVGTRHRAAYRFAHCVLDALLIVISQDGGVQFVRQRHERVTYWDHRPSLHPPPSTEERPR
jgi:hypothetical protein